MLKPLGRTRSCLQKRKKARTAIAGLSTSEYASISLKPIRETQSASELEAQSTKRPFVQPPEGGNPTDARCQTYFNGLRTTKKYVSPS
jgi:hypothetical protein